MKASFQKLTSTSETNSFSTFWVKENAFSVHWHYHPEVEICYVKRGEGHRIVGDSVEDFKPGDLVLLGSNLPHCWISSENFNALNAQMEVFVIQFNTQPLLDDRLPEHASIINLLELAKRGIDFNAVNHSEIYKALKKVNKATGFERYHRLLKLLHLMSLAQKNYLASSLYFPEYSKKTEDRIYKICDYIHANYRQPIKLDTISEMAAMNTSAFCRFFKKNIGKTVIEYTNDLRLAYVTHQLQRSALSINAIAYDAGFNSLTHFNKIFKRHYNETPASYRKTHRSIKI